MNCSLFIYKIPENADLKDGDTIKFSVIDKMGKTLMMITQRHRIMQMLQLAISLRIATQFQIHRLL